MPHPISTAFPAERILLGPGPSPVPQRVLRALAAPTLGHLDPQYLAIMDETCARLRKVFQTKNALTFPVSGTFGPDLTKVGTVRSYEPCS